MMVSRLVEPDPGGQTGHEPGPSLGPVPGSHGPARAPGERNPPDSDLRVRWATGASPAEPDPIEKNRILKRISLNFFLILCDLCKKSQKITIGCSTAKRAAGAVAKTQIMNFFWKNIFIHHFFAECA